jgi:hypothetical protein
VVNPVFLPLFLGLANQEAQTQHVRRLVDLNRLVKKSAKRLKSGTK